MHLLSDDEEQDAQHQLWLGRCRRRVIKVIQGQRWKLIFAFPIIAQSGHGFIFQHQISEWLHSSILSEIQSKFTEISHLKVEVCHVTRPEIVKYIVLGLACWFQNIKLEVNRFINCRDILCFDLISLLSLRLEMFDFQQKVSGWAHSSILNESSRNSPRYCAEKLSWPLFNLFDVIKVKDQAGFRILEVKFLVSYSNCGSIYLALFRRYLRLYRPLWRHQCHSRSKVKLPLDQSGRAEHFCL